jgi:hypothetical protein
MLLVRRPRRNSAGCGSERAVGSHRVVVVAPGRASLARFFTS